MNLWMSLSLYNPLEAFVLLWACHSFNPATRDIKFDFVKNIKHFYILGAILLAIQYIPFVLPASIISMIFINISTFVLIPIIIYLYVNKNMWKLNLNLSYLIFVSYAISNMLTILLFDWEMYGEKTFYFELFSNLILKSIQIMIFYIIRRVYAKRIP